MYGKVHTHSHKNPATTFETIVLATAIAAPLAAVAVYCYYTRRAPKHPTRFVPVNGGSFRIRRKGFSEDQLEGMPMLQLPIKL